MIILWMQDSSTNAEGFHLVGLCCVALRKWQFRYAVSFGEASASESQLQCSSVAQSRAEHVETAVPGSTGTVGPFGSFRIVRFSEYSGRLGIKSWRGLRFSRFLWCRRLRIRPVKRRLVRRRARLWCSSITETWIKHNFKPNLGDLRRRLKILGYDRRSYKILGDLSDLRRSSNVFFVVLQLQLPIVWTRAPWRIGNQERHKSI